MYKVFGESIKITYSCGTSTGFNVNHYIYYKGQVKDGKYQMTIYLQEGNTIEISFPDERDRSDRLDKALAKASRGIFLDKI